jgi:hypothetical protein
MAEVSYMLHATNLEGTMFRRSFTYLKSEYNNGENQPADTPHVSLARHVFLYTVLSIMFMEKGLVSYWLVHVVVY